MAIVLLLRLGKDFVLVLGIGYCKVLACAKKGNKPSRMGEKRSDKDFPPIG